MADPCACWRASAELARRLAGKDWRPSHRGLPERVGGSYYDLRQLEDVALSMAIHGEVADGDDVAMEEHAEAGKICDIAS